MHPPVMLSEKIFAVEVIVASAVSTAEEGMI